VRLHCFVHDTHLVASFGDIEVRKLVGFLFLLTRRRWVSQRNAWNQLNVLEQNHNTMRI
jgi:hypothetical protein